MCVCVCVFCVLAVWWQHGVDDVTLGCVGYGMIIVMMGSVCRCTVALCFFFFFFFFKINIY